jgi:membrane-bound serine protease (ClpP class)
MRRGWPILAAGLMLAPVTPAHAASAGLIQINGAIGPATGSYVSRAIKIATERKDACLIVQLDTPGGLMPTTEEIVKAFYSSQVPIVVFVAPSAANATSAGCFITLAADIAAMAPHTSIGAAHLVQIGPGGTQPQKSDDPIVQKYQNYGIGLIEGIASKRHRNVEWAKSSVSESAVISAEKALELDVIDLIAPDVPSLLKQIDGREVSGATLKTAAAQVVAIPMTVGERVFQHLWRPEVMLVLMLAAIYGIIGELSNPGAVLPGVVGAIALILALYMASILPINVAGLALIGLAVLLFIVDIFAPTHGVLTFGGIIAFFLGALMLFNRADPVFRLSLGYVISATLVTAAFFLFVVGAGLRAQKLPVRVGREIMLGQTVAALAPIDRQQGKVFIEGETWNAVSDVPVETGKPVEIVAIEGLTLKVKPKPV